MGSKAGKQVGSTNEESQVRGCYNFYLHQPGKGVSLGHWPAEVRWAESAVQGYCDVGQPAHDEGSHSSGTVEGTAAPTPARSVPWCWRAWVARTPRAPGQGLDPQCCCSRKSAISVACEAWWSGPLKLPQCPQTGPLHCPSADSSSTTRSQCLQTAPLHCLLVGV